jgi:hypothetical protein
MQCRCRRNIGDFRRARRQCVSSVGGAIRQSHIKAHWLGW